ncbi:protein-L-isoaspartate(D-aspartate) O-methyltransferase [Lampropedia aestuarii]|uniref:Protein-L-isoaspartate O-methyltransferase n=1 Tax=Lampropedia aestuarii TaxID=2562762 RepID=A0A4S5BYG2_9BURK|nr:protein-L-isoaspartate(D-aspartate) O-methyltransferase [Lampropedia aestuarii]MDH5855716.1 protein-L-isoaspartate(D-aspartate) O-methyltransferase [Lampropedia aestuarii]THJ36125.1 protein-L-isoaspartate(D-aspartate) O-methyltransferase [Lampropedia aestuarii]
MTQKKPRFPAQVLPPPSALSPRPVPRPADRPFERSGERPVGGAAAVFSQALAPLPTHMVRGQSAFATSNLGEFASASSQQAARERMARRLMAIEGMHPAVIEAMRIVPRHAFIDSALIGQAYEENSLPIGYGQTISKPTIVARMLSLIMYAYADHAGRIPGRILEVGTGCGYQAAVMSHLATEVYSIERVRGLHERARDNLRPLRVSNLHLLFGDGMAGFASGGPYSAIVSAAGGDAIPQAWVDQLGMGGRIVAPTSTDGGRQVLIVVDKIPSGLRQQALETVHFVPLKSGVA